jgi:hypothetical protein
VEGPDDIAHHLQRAAQVVGNLRGALAFRGGEQYLATAHSEGIRGAQTYGKGTLFLFG